MIISETSALQLHKQLRGTTEPNETYADIVTTERLEDGRHAVLSLYPDMVWTLPASAFPKIVKLSERKLNFSRIPAPHRDAVRQVILTRMMSGLRGNTLVRDFANIVPFTVFLGQVGCTSFATVTPLLTQEYISRCKAHRLATRKRKGKGYSQSALSLKFKAVETCWRALKDSPSAFVHPWPDATADSLSGASTNKGKPKTLVIPDTDLGKVFQYAAKCLDNADLLLKWRDTNLAFTSPGESGTTDYYHRTKNLNKNGYDGTTKDLNAAVRELEGACWLIVLCTTGVRISELGELDADTYYSVTRDDERFHFMVSLSPKTDEGKTSWLCPKIAIRALKIMSRISEPLRQTIYEQRATARSQGDAKEASRLSRICKSAVLAQSSKDFNRINVIGRLAINTRLNKLAQAAGSNWCFEPHQFRRTFARYVVHNQLGDLRYLRDHFKHWSLDMTALYQLDELQDLELYDEVHLAFREHTVELVGHWLEPDTRLAGGLAGPLIAMRNKDESVRTYGSHKDMIIAVSDSTTVRSTGIAWCTNDSYGCGGGECEECEHSVIDDHMQLQWEAIYEQQLELRRIAEELGENGSATIERTITRCESVLTSLGADMSIIKQRVTGHG